MTSRRAEVRQGSPLTPREREVIALIAEDKSNQEIAEALGISKNTVLDLHPGDLRTPGCAWPCRCCCVGCKAGDRVMACPSCTAAERTPNRDGFEQDCRSCKARALAATGAHLESEQRKGITPQYREALEKMFGADAWREGHELVKGWARKLRPSKGTRG